MLSNPLSLRPSPLHVFPLIFCQMFNYAILRVSIPSLLVHAFNDNVSLATLAIGVVDCIGALLAFGVLPSLGEYSDRKGRKPILLITLFFTSLPVLSLSLYPFFPLYAINAFLASQVLAKLSPFSSVYSYVADLTDEGQRSKAIGQISAVVFLALTSGPLVAKYTDMETSFLIAASVSLVCFLYCLGIMPDSLDQLPQREGESKPLLSPTSSLSFPSSSLSSINNASVAEAAEGEAGVLDVPVSNASHLSLFSTLSFMLRSHYFTLLFLMVIFEQLAVYGINEVFLLYLMKVVSFDRDDNITLGIGGGIATCLCMLLLLPLLSRVMGEKKLIIFCILLYLLYSILYIFVKEKYEVFVLVLVSSLSHLSYPATCTLLSYSVEHREMGLAQAALAGIRSLSLGVGPLLFAVIFAYFSQEDIPYSFPQMPFVVSALLTFISLLYALRLPNRSSLEEGQYMKDIERFNRGEENKRKGKGECAEEEEDQWPGEDIEDLEAEESHQHVLHMRRRDSDAELAGFLLVKQLNAKSLVK